MAGSPRVPRCPEDKTGSLVFCARPRGAGAQSWFGAGAGGGAACRLATGGSFHFHDLGRPTPSPAAGPRATHFHPPPRLTGSARTQPATVTSCDFTPSSPFFPCLSLQNSTEGKAQQGEARASSLALPRLIQPPDFQARAHPKGRAPLGSGDGTTRRRRWPVQPPGGTRTRPRAPPSLEPMLASSFRRKSEIPCPSVTGDRWGHRVSSPSALRSPRSGDTNQPRSPP